MELGYARVSTTKQDLERQIDALTATGIAADRIYVDRKSGATTDRTGLTTLLEYARDGDVITVHTLDRLGRNVRDTLNLIHDLRERGIGIRNLADPIRIDSSNPDDPMAQLAVVLLALFAQMERTYTLERAAHARAVATAKGRRTGRPSVVTESQIAHAIQLRNTGATITDIVTKTGLTRSTLYRHLPPRPDISVTAATAVESDTKTDSPTAIPEPRPRNDRLACPTCGHRPATRQETGPHLDDLAMLWLHIDPDGQITEHRHCVRCQPHQHITAISCSRCGDGPLAVGSPDTTDLPTSVHDWLVGRGWSTTPDVLCTKHS